MTQTNMESEDSSTLSPTDSTALGSSNSAESTSIGIDWDFDDVQSFKRELEDCLENVHGKGSFATYDRLESMPNPGLLVQGRSIGLPISEDDAKFMIEASHRAPFGKGNQTIVDESVRKTWEISGDDFALRNPTWKKFMLTVVDKATEGLGIFGNGQNIRAELYEMLIYEEGAMFKPHQDSEKTTGMFGTLVISLPSKHLGGEVVATHAGRYRRLRTSPGSEFGSTYLAWYSDVVHEVKPVISGYRIVLIYNLVHIVHGVRPLADTSSSGLARVISMIRNWKVRADQRGMYASSLAYRLAHYYTDNSLCYSALKGHDAQVVHILKEAAEMCDFVVYLGNIEKPVEGACDGDKDDYGHGAYGMHGDNMSIHSVCDEIDRGFVLKKVVFMDGKVAALHLPYDEGYVVQKSLGKPDCEDFSGPTGNEGVTTTHFYNRTVVIFMPKKSRLNFLLNPNNGSTWKDVPNESRPIIDWLNHLKPILGLEQYSVSKEAKKESSNICKVVLNRMITWSARPTTSHSQYYKKEPPFKNDVFTRVLEAAIDIGDKELFLDLYNAFSGDWSRKEPKDFFQVGCGVNQFQIEDLEATLETDLSKFEFLSERYQALVALKSGSQTSRSQTTQGEELREFCDTQLEECLITMPLVTAEDGLALANCTAEVPSIDTTEIVQALKENARSTAMVLAYLCAVFTQAGAGKRSNSSVAAIFTEIISDVVGSFNLDALTEPLASNSTERHHTYQMDMYGSATKSSTAQENPILHHSSFNLAGFLFECWNLGCEFPAIVAKVVEEAQVVKFSYFGQLLLPALKTLSSHLQKHQIQVKSTPFQDLYQGIFTIYLQRFVGSKPPPARNWTQTEVRGSCNDCVELNKFLRSPTQIEAHFQMALGQREHIYTKCYAADVDLTTDCSGQTHTLVVKKRNQEFFNLEYWKKRRAEAPEVARTLNFEMMRELLGTEYDNIMNCSILDAIPQDTQSAERAGSSNIPEYHPILPGTNVSNPPPATAPAGASLGSGSGNSGDSRAINLSGSRKRKWGIIGNGPEGGELELVD